MLRDGKYTVYVSPALFIAMTATSLIFYVEIRFSALRLKLCRFEIRMQILLDFKCSENQPRGV